MVTLEDVIERRVGGRRDFFAAALAPAPATSTFVAAE